MFFLAEMQLIETFKILYAFLTLTMDKNYDAFMKMNLSPYLGEWIAVCENRIVAHGKKVKDVFYEAKGKCPGNRSFIAKVPGKEAWIFLEYN